MMFLLARAILGAGAAEVEASFASGVLAAITDGVVVVGWTTARARAVAAL